MRMTQGMHIQLWIVLILSLTLAGITACSSNPLAVAQNDEQRAYALLGLSAIVVSAGADIIEDPTVDLSIRRSLQKALADAREPIESLDEAAMEYLSIKNQFLAGDTTESRVQIAADNLISWINLTEPIITQLSQSVGR